MSPPDAGTVRRRELLRQREPETIAATLVLNLQIGGNIPAQYLVDCAQGCFSGQRILRADFERPFVTDIVRIGTRRVMPMLQDSW